MGCEAAFLDGLLGEGVAAGEEDGGGEGLGEERSGGEAGLVPAAVMLDSQARGGGQRGWG